MPDQRGPLAAGAELLALDRQHVWHPYGPMPGRQEPLIIASASGVRLRLADPSQGHGHEELVDGMSSWWSAIHGYNHPVLNEAATAQLGLMSHVMFGGLTHEPAVRLAAKLVEITPPGLEHVFLSDSGSVSVEVAVKMCLQYWRSLGHTGKTRLLTWRGGYHGDTWQPMAVCDPDGGMHELWQGHLPRQVFADAPPAGFDTPVDPAYADHLRATISAHADELAAVIVEPVVQGAGGMRFHHPGYLRVLRELCDEYGVLLILDEIATGFGRTGALFAADHAGITPDVMCLGKSLTGVTSRWRRPCARSGWRAASPRARSRCWRTGRPSWATRWPRPWPWPPSSCCSARTGRPTSSGSRRGCARACRPRPTSPG